MKARQRSPRLLPLVATVATAAMMIATPVTVAGAQPAITADSEPTTTTSTEATPPPAAATDEKVKIELQLKHPVTVADAMTVADELDVRELQYNIDGAAGGVIVTPGATAEDVQDELHKATARHGFHPPIDTVVVAVEAQPTTQPQNQNRGAQLQTEAAVPDPEAKQEAETLAQELKAKPEADLKGKPQQPTLGTAPVGAEKSATGPARQQVSKYAWTPTYANSTAWEFEPGIATFQHDVAWSSAGGFISDIDPEHGFEIGDKQFNYSLPGGVRPGCELNPGSDDGAFWAQREGDAHGAPKTWG